MSIPFAHILYENALSRPISVVLDENKLPVFCVSTTLPTCEGSCVSAHTAGTCRPRCRRRDSRDDRLVPKERGGRNPPAPAGRAESINFRHILTITYAGIKNTLFSFRSFGLLLLLVPAYNYNTIGAKKKRLACCSQEITLFNKILRSIHFRFFFPTRVEKVLS